MSSAERAGVRTFRLIAEWADREIATLDPGIFALVMATGIISNALLLQRHGALSDAMFAVNLLAYPWLLLLTVVRAARYAKALAADLLSPQRVFSFFTIVAATNLMGMGAAIRGFDTVALLLLSMVPPEMVSGPLPKAAALLTFNIPPESVTPPLSKVFAPPSVKGWDGEQKWINSSLLAARQAFAERIGELVSANEFGPHLDLARLVPEEVVDPARVADLLAEQILESDLSAERRKELADFLVEDEDEEPQPEKFRTDADFRRQQVRAALGVLLGMPEYQTY